MSPPLTIPHPTHSTTVPCQYRTGRSLGTGAYCIVKEAYHIHTGERYAAKAIRKSRLRGKEHLLRSEVSIMRKISAGHPNLLTLHDCFETVKHVYLVTELAEGGDLFSRISSHNGFSEARVATLIYQILVGLAYLHKQGIVHRDIKPENILFRTRDKDSDLLIADFGLSTLLSDDTAQAPRSKCGTMGYMAPEILLCQSYGRPVDMWAVGVMTYLLLSGYMPFDYGSATKLENDVDDYDLICDLLSYGRDLKFEPSNKWARISSGARNFIASLIVIEPERRLTATMALQHPWLTEMCSNSFLSPQSIPYPPGCFTPVTTLRSPSMLSTQSCPVRYHSTPDAEIRLTVPMSVSVASPITRSLESPRAPPLWSAHSETLVPSPLPSSPTSPFPVDSSSVPPLEGAVGKVDDVTHRYHHTSLLIQTPPVKVNPLPFIRTQPPALDNASTAPVGHSPGGQSLLSPYLAWKSDLHTAVLTHDHLQQSPHQSTKTSVLSPNLATELPCPFKARRKLRKVLDVVRLCVTLAQAIDSELFHTDTSPASVTPIFVQ
ncbi:Calcium/calmodulin-dependent protein kinase type I [Dispira simplex]|nr:Calcium/calmodulin-dependent protein kinase type I [Dispira simplex]